MSDLELLQEYALRHSEEAFAALVARHIDLVYSAALRHTGNHHQAEEIVQAVFVILARKARSLGPRTVLPGWLFQTTRLTAANYLRTEIRRARREQEACMQSNTEEPAGDPWQQVAPMLNDAVAGLGEKDRDAIVLRFLKGKNFKEVGAALGGTEEAAQMRVGRALEKLRKLFARRGVVLSATALGATIAANGTQAAPAGFAAAVAAAAVQGTALTASTLALVKGTLKLMSWTKIQIAVGVGVAALLLYQHVENSAQARELISARDALRSATEEFAAQETRISELEQQTAAIVEVRQSQERELSLLRSQRTATAGADRSNAAGRAPTTLLSASLQDPGAREYLRSEMIKGYRGHYGQFLRDLKVDPQAAEQLLQKAGDGAMNILDAIAATSEGKISADAAVQVEMEVRRNATNQIRLMWGDEAVAKFEEYSRAFPANNLVGQLDRQLKKTTPLNADQRAQLREVIHAEPFEVTRLLASEIPIDTVVSPDTISQAFERETEVNRRILQNAAGFLSPDQLEGLAHMQAYNLSSQKQTILRMLRKQ